MQADDLTAVADAVLLASRVLLAVAAQSLAEVNDMSLPQFRILIVLVTRGDLNVGQLAEDLDVNPSTATRLCDRLVERGFLRRQHGEDDRREVCLCVTPTGRDLVDRVIDRRRRALGAIVARIAPEKRQHLVQAMQAFGDAAGEVPHQSWSVGWSMTEPAKEESARTGSTPGRRTAAPIARSSDDRHRRSPNVGKRRGGDIRKLGLPSVHGGE